MAITDILFHPIFLLNIGITFLVIGCLFFYIETSNRLQNHKLVTMSNLIASIHKKVNEIDLYLLSTSGSTVTTTTTTTHIPFEEQTGGANESNIRLIHVSDNEESDYEEDEEEEDEEDEEYEEEDSEEEDDVDEEDGEEDGEEDVDVHEEPIKVIKIEETFTPMEELQEDLQEDLHEDLHEELQEADVDPNSVNLLDLKSIDILEVDYTKYSVSKLKQVIVEKGLATDVSISKLKKNELLKLLGVSV